jgi:hypothetical protein
MSDCANPVYYKQYPTEAIDMMVSIWGAAKVADYCEINAFKYRMRLGYKGLSEEFLSDLKKECWYLAKARELRNSEKI